MVTTNKKKPVATHIVYNQELSTTQKTKKKKTDGKQAEKSTSGSDVLFF